MNAHIYTHTSLIVTRWSCHNSGVIGRFCSYKFFCGHVIENLILVLKYFGYLDGGSDIVLLHMLLFWNPRVNRSTLELFSNFDHYHD